MLPARYNCSGKRRFWMFMPAGNLILPMSVKFVCDCLKSTKKKGSPNPGRWLIEKSHAIRVFKPVLISRSRARMFSRLPESFPETSSCWSIPSRSGTNSARSRRLTEDGSRLMSTCVKLSLLPGSVSLTMAISLLLMTELSVSRERSRMKKSLPICSTLAESPLR